MDSSNKRERGDADELFGEIPHGHLKLRTVHLSDNTIIYESKVSVKNIFLLI
jgi:hypothetical protein